MNINDFEKKWAYDPSCVFYFPATYVEGIAGSNVVTEKSGCGRVITSSGSYADGVNGWYFDGSDDYLSLSDFIGTGAITTITVTKVSSWGGGNYGRILSNGKYDLYLHNNAKLEFRSDGTTAVATETSSLSLNTRHTLGCSRKSSGLATLYIDGNVNNGTDQDSGTPANGTTDAIIGNRAAADRALAGYIRVLLIYNRLLSAIEHSDLTRDMEEVFP